MRRILSILSFLLLVVPLAKGATIILTSDQQLSDLMDPDKKIDVSTGYTPMHMSLREVCEQARAKGDKTLTIAFDEFFRQYRPQAGTDRKLTPDMDEYIEKIKFISDFAKKYGMGIGLSINTPLELGPAFINKTGEPGHWVAYKVGLRNASDGSFSLPMWQQIYWVNNKGKFNINFKGVRAYAFKQKPLGKSHLISVNPDDIKEIRGVKYEAGDTVNFGLPARELRIYYDGPTQLPGYDMVLAILEFDTPEMDYFSPQASPFLHNLMDKYKKAGVNLTEFYSDEMHIQQDWAYFGHHDGGQFVMRFLTKNFSDMYQHVYGQPFDERYMLYFVYGAPYYKSTADAVENVQYVMGETPEDIHRTFILRDRYYKMLNNTVVDLFKDSKDYAEKLFGREFRTAAHSSWAESPTCDYIDVEKLHANAYLYEYTSDFIWSNTVHQAAAACYDYFKWGEYLQPTGNDFAEGGWSDRDYYGTAMAASLGVINKYPSAYAGIWGFPDKALYWKQMLNEAYGATPGKAMSLMTDYVHRDIEVLAIYPMNLVSVEERFGSWMTQYGYCNYLTSEKLVELGNVTDEGKMRVKAKEYGTIMVMFEPLPSKGLLDLLEKFTKSGGKVIWFSMPPLIDGTGNNCTAQWQRMFGVEYKHDQYLGEKATGKQIKFCGSLSSIPSQTILTGMLVDKVYPVKILGGAEIAAKIEDEIVGTRRKLGRGEADFFGFRPRDDQSGSLGYETRTLFEILNSVGAYPSSGKFSTNDNPTYISRTTEYLATSFPNGAVALVKHYRTHRENWPGGFSRDRALDEKILKDNPLPSDNIEIEGLKVRGHEITYKGKMNMAFNVDERGNLIGFNGVDCTGITLDGKEYVFSDRPVTLTFAPLNGDKRHYQMSVNGATEVIIPLPAGVRKAIVKDGKKTVKSSLSEGAIKVFASSHEGKWLDISLSY